MTYTYEVPNGPKFIFRNREMLLLI